jgi:hypothetical protein
MIKPNKSLVRKHIEVLNDLKGYTIEAGFFESARYRSVNGEPGPSVAYIARINNDGATITIPAHTQTIINEFKIDRKGKIIYKFVKHGKGKYAQKSVVVIPSHKVTIPARPFMKYAYELFVKGKSRFMKNLAERMFHENIPADQALKDVADYLEYCIIRSIKNGDWTPNAPSTKARKGFDKPLIDKGTMWQAVTSMIIKKGS